MGGLGRRYVTVILRAVTTYRRALALLLLAGVLALVAASERLHGLIVDLLHWVEPVMSMRPVLGAALFVVLAALSAMLAFFSSAIIVPAGVMVWGRALTMFLLWLGWILGGVGAYTVARYLGRPAVQRLASEKLIERYEKFLSPRTHWGFVLLFQTALPSEIPGYLLGLTRYPMWKYLGVLAVAELPYAVATVYLGESFLERRTTLLIVAGAAMAAFSYWVLRMLRRRVEA